MAVTLKANIKMIKNTARVNLSGQMEEYMKVNGNLVNNTVKVFIQIRKVKNEKGFGK